jgi:prophage tail gpP-like protein
MLDDLTLEVGGRALSGWTGVRVTRGIERMPSDFSIELTELHPDDVDSFTVQTGEFCVVKLGKDPVVTGYIDRVGMLLDRAQHSITVSGRGKCADLVDCSAEWPGGQISSTSTRDIASKLAEPYGAPGQAISVTLHGDDTIKIPVQNLILGETPYQIIERVCRFAALLAYETADGNLLLTRAGDGEAASGVEQGRNVQRAAIEYSMDQRYSEVLGYIQSFDALSDLGDTGNLQFVATDPNITRHRRLSVIAEPGDSLGFPVLEQRVKWEIARRFGRSRALHVTVDSWRDAAGKLWEPNTLAPIYLPALKLAKDKWLITEVTYNRSLDGGTTADLVMMPRSAFLPQPVVLLPSLAGVDQQDTK